MEGLNLNTIYCEIYQNVHNENYKEIRLKASKESMEEVQNKVRGEVFNKASWEVAFSITNQLKSKFNK